MSVERAVAALRSSAGLSRPTHVAAVHVDGPRALDLLERATSLSLHLREGRARHTLLLREDAGILADVYVGSADDGFYVLAEGPTEPDLVAWLEEVGERAGVPHARPRGLSAEHALFAVDGPFAWELLAEVLGASVLGMPYLSFLRREDALCLRAGKTGEYGYLLLVAQASAPSFEARLRDAGRAIDLHEVALDALDVCALENGQFSMRTVRETELARPLTPLELQLQWRVSYRKEFVGAQALKTRRARGPEVRATCFTADGPVAAGQIVQIDGDDVGEVLAARHSPTLGAWVGSALLRTRFAHPHLHLSAISASGATPLVTRTGPLVDNLSLRVDFSKHSYATRSTIGSSPKAAAP